MKILKDFWFHLKRRLLPLSPPETDFLEWCKVPPPTLQNSLNFQSQNNGVNSDQELKQFFANAQSRLTNGSDAVVDVQIIGPCRQESVLYAHSLSYSRFYGNLLIHNPVLSLTLDSFYIANLGLSHSEQRIVIKNSKIKTLFIHANAKVDLEIQDTYVGKVVFHGSSLKRFAMRGGGISQIEIDPQGSVNPFTGSVWFVDTWLPTDKNMIQGPQPYRNMRHHLRSLSNMQMADLFHALELRTERKQETWTNKTISYLYDVFSDFGASILRPVLWLLLLGCSVAYVLIRIDGAVPTHELVSSAVGWQTALLEHDIFAPIARGFYLSFYSITHPLGLFGGQPVLLASSAWLSGLLIIEGIFSATLIALTIFALRRRFKLQAT